MNCYHRRDPRKKPSLDVNALNKRDPRRKNRGAEQPGFQQSVQQPVTHSLLRPAYASQLLQNHQDCK